MLLLLAATASALTAQDLARAMTGAWDHLQAYRSTQIIQERVRGELGAEQQVRVAFRKPWEIQLEWDTVHPGRRVYWSAARHGGDVQIYAGGLTGRALGILSLSPDNALLKRDTNYSVKDAGFGYLVRAMAATLSPTSPQPPTVSVPVEQAVRGERAWRLDLSDLHGMRYTRAELLLSVATGLPLGYTAWAADGALAEHYEWRDTVLDPALNDAVDFSAGYPAP